MKIRKLEMKSWGETWEEKLCDIMEKKEEEKLKL